MCVPCGDGHEELLFFLSRDGVVVQPVFFRGCRRRRLRNLLEDRQQRSLSICNHSTVLFNNSYFYLGQGVVTINNARSIRVGEREVFFNFLINFSG